MFKNTNKKILIFIATISIALLCLKLTYSSNHTIPTFNLSSKDNLLEDDLNGDKKKESILIKDTTQGLIGQVNLNKNRTFSLDCPSELPTIGQYCSYWPTRITTLDISRDNSKEIFIQSSFNNKAIQHIFSWNGSKYINIFSSTDNILGFINSQNDKSPLVAIGNFQGGEINFKNYLYNKGIFEELNSNSNLSIPGKDTITNLIALIQSLPNQYIQVPNYFYSQISGSDLESLFRLANTSNKFQFQDGYFIDLAWQENGTVTHSNWILNFRSVSTSDSSTINNMTINLMLNKHNDDDFPYKITSFNVYE